MGADSANKVDAVTPSVFESEPQQSKAAVTHAQAHATETSEQSVFESYPEQSKAAVTHADIAKGADTSQTVFESEPKEHVTNARAGADGTADSESEWETDDEA